MFFHHVLSFFCSFLFFIFIFFFDTHDTRDVRILSNVQMSELSQKYDYRLLIDRALIRYFKYAVFMYMMDNRLKGTI